MLRRKILVHTINLTDYEGSFSSSQPHSHLQIREPLWHFQSTGILPCPLEGEGSSAIHEPAGVDSLNTAVSV